MIQPLDQGIIATFKLYYIQRAFQHILDAVEQDNLTIVDAWKKYSILDCITYASMAKEKLRVSTLNSCWKALWPECVKSGTSVPQASMETSEIIALAHEIGGEGFEDLQIEDVDELMIDKPLDDDCLIQLITDDGKTENHVSDNDEETEICQLTASLIDDGLSFGKSMVNHFLKNDPNMERALKFERDINNCIAGYKELYKEFKKPKVQLSIKDFLIKKSTAQDLSESSPTVQNSITGRKSPLDNLMEISSDDTDFSPVRRKQLRLLSSSDE